MLGVEWNFLILLHAGLAARNAAEGTDLEFPMIAFLVELDQHVVGRVVSIGNVQVKHRMAVANNIPRGVAFNRRVPVLIP